MPSDKKIENPDASYTKNYQGHVACCYGYKTIWIDVQYSKLFKSHLGKKLVYTFICDMIEEKVSIVGKYLIKNLVNALL